MTYPRSERAGTIWLFGLSGSGKTTFARHLIENIWAPTLHIDGDVMREVICADLGFSMEDRITNIMRAAGFCCMCNDQGITCVVSMITPKKDMRDVARRLIGEHRFSLIYMSTPIEVCEERDPKGLYAANTHNLTGRGQEFEFPLPEENTSLILDTSTTDFQSMKVLARGFVHKKGF